MSPRGRKSTTPKRRAPEQQRPKPRKNRWIREIKKYRMSTDLLLRRLPFSRLVREICLRCSPEVTRWQTVALRALQEATEAFLVQLFSDCALMAAHAKRVTIMPNDVKLLLYVTQRGRNYWRILRNGSYWSDCRMLLPLRLGAQEIARRNDTHFMILKL